ncbi:MAG: hypothetical protein GY851_31295, partial [bacterium]|nr:hypothetical protein [bacterium]
GTVQDAVNASTSTGDVVKVAGHCGTLNAQGGTAQVVRITRTLTIRGGYTVTNWTTSDPAANPAVLDAKGAGTVLHISGDIAPVIEGLHVTGGASDAFHGAGIHNDGSASTLSNVTISGNVAWDLGGGIYNLNDGDMTLTDVVIHDNAAWPAHPYGFGGGMYNNRSDATLTNVVFYDNKASKGGGIASDRGHLTLTNVTLTANWAVFGDGIYNRYSDPSLTNCIVWGNRPENIFNVPGTGADPVITYSNIEDGYAGTGNIDANPLFANAASGNLRLQSTSPAIDAGDNAAVSVATDLDGHPRRTDVSTIPDTGNGTAPIVDMGAYEYHARALAIAKSA